MMKTPTEETLNKFQEKRVIVPYKINIPNIQMYFSLQKNLLKCTFHFNFLSNQLQEKQKLIDFPLYEKC